MENQFNIGKYIVTIYELEYGIEIYCTSVDDSYKVSKNNDALVYKATLSIEFFKHFDTKNISIMQSDKDSLTITDGHSYINLDKIKYEDHKLIHFSIITMNKEIKVLHNTISNIRDIPFAYYKHNILDYSIPKNTWFKFDQLFTINYIQKKINIDISSLELHYLTNKHKDPNILKINLINNESTFEPITFKFIKISYMNNNDIYVIPNVVENKYYCYSSDFFLITSKF